MPPTDAPRRVSGTEGYGETAARLVGAYETVAFEDVHADVLHLFPAPPSRVIDIGAGTGRDAAALAGLGHDVTAAEPTPTLRDHGKARHSAWPIAWIDDALPDLDVVRGLGRTFDLVLLTGVWMHLDPAQRRRGMPHVAGLLAPGGVMALRLRHGPVPAGRRMFDVSIEETAALAEANGLRVIHRGGRPGLFGVPGVHWSVVVFRRD
ncbi:MAG: class I SAM-dependent methyltransferase [Reyranellaceae bacterium]